MNTPGFTQKHRYTNAISCTRVARSLSTISSNSPSIRLAHKNGRASISPLFGSGTRFMNALPLLSIPGVGVKGFMADYEALCE